MKNCYPISAIWILVILTSISFFSNAQAQTVRLDSTYTYSILSPTDSIPIQKRLCSYSTYKGDAACFNFSSCIEYSWNFSFNKWEPVRKEDLRRDDEKNTRASISFNWDNAKRVWTPAYKEVYFSPNNNYSSYRYIYDLDNKEWVAVDYFSNYSTDREYYFELKRTDFNDRTTSGRRELSKNNNLGQRVESQGDIWDDTKKDWVQSTRFEFTYTTFGRRLTETGYYWRNDIEDWELESFYQTNYDVSGNRISIVVQNFRDFVDRLTEYEYDSLGNISAITTSSRPNALAPMTFEQRRETSFENGRQIGEEVFRWENDMWVLDAFNAFELNAEGQDSLFEAFQWVPDSNDFILVAREETAYDEQDRVNDRKSLYFSTFDNRYYGFRYQVTFDSQGRNISDIYSDYSNETREFVLQNRYDRAFNPSGQTILSENYRWDPLLESWQGQRKNTYSYVGSGNYKRVGTYTWDINLNEFTISESKIYNWGVCAEENLVEQDTDEFRLFPNPVTDNYLNLLSDFRPFTYELTSVDGRRVLQGQSESNLTQIDVGDLQNGVYILTFSFLKKKLQKKVVINHP
ncbi:MAG: T9SS type A sorting domain-containing protein [Bacteroidota bacterium]